jgi:uncharacterized protein YqgV (UPF0045/DUF77 family)
MNIKEFIQKLKQSEDYKKFKGEMSEMSVTGAVAGYDTPKAFAPSEKEFEAHSKETAEVYGYTVVPKQKKKNFESTYVQAIKSLTEASYKSYKTDETRTVNAKINQSIKEINRAIYEIERVVNHASRLKTEMAIDQRTLWSSSHSRLHKIGERLNRIGKKINELGA